MIWRYRYKECKKKKKTHQSKNRSGVFKTRGVLSFRPFMAQGQVDHVSMAAASHNQREDGITRLCGTESSLL